MNHLKTHKKLDLKMFPTVIVLPVEIFENFLDKGFHSVQFIFSYIIFWSLKARRKTFKGPASSA